MWEWLDVCVYLCSTILKLTLSVSAWHSPLRCGQLIRTLKAMSLRTLVRRIGVHQMCTHFSISPTIPSSSGIWNTNLRFRFLQKHIIFVQSLPHNWTAKISLFRVFIFHKITALIFCYKSNCLNESSQITFNAAAKFWNIISFTNFIRFTNEACPEQLFCVFFGEQCVS